MEFMEICFLGFVVYWYKYIGIINIINIIGEQDFSFGFLLLYFKNSSKIKLGAQLGIIQPPPKRERGQRGLLSISSLQL